MLQRHGEEACDRAAGRRCRAHMLLCFVWSSFECGHRWLQLDCSKWQGHRSGFCAHMFVAVGWTGCRWGLRMLPQPEFALQLVCTQHPRRRLLSADTLRRAPGCRCTELPCPPLMLLSQCPAPAGGFHNALYMSLYDSPCRRSGVFPKVSCAGFFCFVQAIALQQAICNPLHQPAAGRCTAADGVERAPRSEWGHQRHLHPARAAPVPGAPGQPPPAQRSPAGALDNWRQLCGIFCLAGSSAALQVSRTSGSRWPPPPLLHSK